MDYFSSAISGTDRGAVMPIIIRVHPSAEEEYREARRRYERKELVKDVVVVMALAAGIGYVFYSWLNWWC